MTLLLRLFPVVSLSTILSCFVFAADEAHPNPSANASDHSHSSKTSKTPTKGQGKKSSSSSDGADTSTTKIDDQKKKLFASFAFGSMGQFQDEYFTVLRAQLKYECLMRTRLKYEYPAGSSLPAGYVALGLGRSGGLGLEEGPTEEGAASSQGDFIKDHDPQGTSLLRNPAPLDIDALPMINMLFDYFGSDRGSLFRGRVTHSMTHRYGNVFGGNKKVLSRTANMTSYPRHPLYP